jgi:molybdopterin converting factor small subunit
LISVQVQYFAALREQRGLSHEQVSTQAATLQDLYEELPLRFPAALVRFAVNGEFAGSADPIKDGDVILLLPPMAGG